MLEMTDTVAKASLDTFVPALASAFEAPRIARLKTLFYLDALQRMRAFVARREPSTADEIWLLEHPPVYTLGQAGRIEHLLKTDTNIPVERVERGGQITYHGPGQLVAYPLIDLRRRDIKVRDFVRLVEGAMIDTLKTYNVAGLRKPGAPGIYVDFQGELAKIGALGLKIRNGSTFHGLALNVAMDLSPFKAINPCGYEGLVTVDLKSLEVDAEVAAVGERLADALVQRIQRKDWS
jgi:lipoyl(octanoyl) transferase